MSSFLGQVGWAETQSVNLASLQGWPSVAGQLVDNGGCFLGRGISTDPTMQLCRQKQTKQTRGSRRCGRENRTLGGTRPAWSKGREEEAYTYNKASGYMAVVFGGHAMFCVPGVLYIQRKYLVLSFRGGEASSMFLQVPWKRLWVCLINRPSPCMSAEPWQWQWQSPRLVALTVKVGGDAMPPSISE
jgi:hypothetical protein